MNDARRGTSRVMAEGLQPPDYAELQEVDFDAGLPELEHLFRADAPELNGSGQQIARLSCAPAAREEERSRRIAETERGAPSSGSLGLPLGMRIDPRTTELRASLRADYERSGRPPLDSAYDAEPLVSVVIPCYNYGYYLEDAILSAMMACSHPMEILVVDDGSTDEGSLGAVEDLAARYRFRLLRQRNTGQNGARYEGFRSSRGKFIQFLDADDLLAPGKIDLQVDMMTGGRGIDIAVCEYELCDADGEGRRLMAPSTLAGFAFTTDDFLLRWGRGFSLPIHCALFRREVLDPQQFQSVTKAGKEDWIFWIVVASKSPRFHFHPEVLTVYRVHGHNTFTNYEGAAIDFLHVCMYVLQAGLDRCDNFLEESIDHFRKVYLRSIMHAAEARLAQATFQAAYYKNLLGEPQRLRAETLLAHAENHKTLLEEQRQLRMELNSLRASYQAALSEGTAFRQSLSWRIMAPLRYLGSVLRFR